MDRFVALMRRYCIDYTCAHDTSVIPEIMSEDYVVHVSGMDLERDSGYLTAVGQIFDRFPALGLVVHELVTNGERLAMRFSEHGVAPAEGHLPAAWAGISTYRWDGTRLLECFVEQDFLAQWRQLRTGEVAPLESPHVDPWLSAAVGPTDSASETVAREWLLYGDLRNADDAVVDGSWHGDVAETPIEVGTVTVDDLFSAGDRVAFHVTQRGRYAGGLPGCDHAVGRPVTLRVSGLLTVRCGRVVAARSVTDRMGARTTLRAMNQEPRTASL